MTQRDGRLAEAVRFARLLGEAARRAGTTHDFEPVIEIRWRRMTPTEGRFECEFRGGDVRAVGVGESAPDAIDSCLRALDRWREQKAGS